MPLAAAALVLLTLLWAAAAPAWAAEPAKPFFAALGIDTVDGRQSAVAVPLADGRVLIAGGSDDVALRSAEIFDPVGVEFEAVPNLTRYARTGAVGAPLPDGRVLIAAGGSNNVAYAHAEVFDPETEKFTDVEGEMATTRGSAMAAALPDGRVLIAGGRADAKTLASAELFDPATETFSPLAATMARERHDAVATALPDGRVLIAGGYGQTKALRSAEVFDPATGTFSLVVQDMGQDVADAAGAALPSGEVVIAGGTVGGFAVRNAGLLDPDAGSFLPLPNSGGTRLSTERNNAIAAVLPNGMVLFAGGSWPEARSSAEIYLSAPSLDAAGNQLGSHLLGTQSTPSNVEVTNLGWVDLEIDAVAIGGPDAADFALLSDSCSGAELGFGESCTLGVRFTPSRLGAAAASLGFDDNEPAPTAVSLTAAGVAPTPPVSPGPPLGPPEPQLRAFAVRCGVKPIARTRRVKVTCRANPDPGAWEARLRQAGRTIAVRRLSGGPHTLVFRPLRKRPGGFRLELAPLPGPA